jgi:hypothetical protein
LSQAGQGFSMLLAAERIVTQSVTPISQYIHCCDSCLSEPIRIRDRASSVSVLLSLEAEKMQAENSSLSVVIFSRLFFHHDAQDDKDVKDETLPPWLLNELAEAKRLELGFASDDQSRKSSNIYF